MTRLPGLVVALLVFLGGVAGCCDLTDGCSDWTDGSSDWTSGESQEWHPGADPPMDPDMWARFHDR